VNLATKKKVAIYTFFGFEGNFVLIAMHKYYTHVHSYFEDL